MPQVPFATGPFVAHWHGFRVFGGVPGRGIYDNMRTAVDRVGRGKERQINLRFLAMTNYYVFESEFYNPAAGWEKGQVEKNVRESRHQILRQMPDFPDLDALNAWLTATLGTIVNGHKQAQIDELLPWKFTRNV